MSDANGKPLPGCDDYLGLIAKQDVLIIDTAVNGNDVKINAAILTLGDSFTVQKLCFRTAQRRFNHLRFFESKSARSGRHVWLVGYNWLPERLSL